MDLDEKKVIEQIIRNINNAWTTANFEDLNEYFHEDMIIAQPGKEIMGKGRQTCVESYRQFVNNVELKEYYESNYEINIWGNTAVVSYSYDIIYKMNNKEFDESGVDVFVFSRAENKWLAVWRSISPVSSA